MRANDYGLGDIIKAATTKVGIKPCSGCQRRAEMLNEWSRRSFLGKAIMFPFLLKASLAMAVTNIIDGDVKAAINLMRALNTATASLQTRVENPDGTHTLNVPTKADILAALTQNAKEADPTKRDGAFLKSLAPTDRNGEILSGWITDIDARPHGYVIVTSRKVDQNNLSARRDVLITDNMGVILRAYVYGPAQATAASLKSATDFPGAVPFDLFVEEEHHESK